MEHALHTHTRGMNCVLVRDIGLNNFDSWIINVLLEVSAAAYHEAVQHAHAPTFRHQPFYKMTSDETRTTGDQIQICHAHEVDSPFSLPRQRLLIDGQKYMPSHC